MLYLFPRVPNFILFHDELVLRYKVVETQKCAEWPQKDIQKDIINTYVSKVTCKHAVLTAKGQIMVCLVHDKPFSIYKVVENKKNRQCNEWPRNGLEHLTVKSTLFKFLPPKAHFSKFGKS